MKLKELIDSKNSYSVTRWGFVVTLIFDMVVILLSIGLYVGLWFTKKPLDNSFFYAVATLCGILTAITGTAKVTQGFEKHENGSFTNKVEIESSNIKIDAN